MQLDFSQKKSPKAVLPEGMYEFAVAAATPTVSAAGNEMIALTLIVNDSTGKPHELQDWFGQWNVKTIKQFCHATGLHSILSKPELNASDLVNARGTCVVVVEAPTGGYRHSTNKVKGYLPLKSSPAPKEPPEVNLAAEPQNPSSPAAVPFASSDIDASACR